MSLADEWDSIPASPGATASASAAGSAPASLADTWDAITPAEAKTAAAPKPGAVGETADRLLSAPKSVAQIVTNQVSAIGHQIMGGWRGLAALASGAGLDEAVRQTENPELAGGTTAATYQPPAGSDAAKVTNALASKYNPLNLPAVAGAKAGEITYDVTGSPAAAAAVETGVNAVPLLLIRGGKAGAGPRPEPKLVGSGSAAETPKVFTPAQIAEGTNYDVPTVIRRRAQAAVPAEGAPAAAPTAQSRAPLSLVPQEGASIRPAVSAFDEPTPEAAAVKAEAAAPKFEQASPAIPEGTTLPASEQARRAAVLDRIGLDNARESAITGDAKAASTDFQTSKLDNSAGNYMRATLDNERAALANHAENIVRDTGGTIGTDEPSLLTRGNTILQPLSALKGWFDAKTKALYQAADARAQGVPADMAATRSFIGGDQAEFLGTQEGESLLKGVQARMKSLGMMGEDGAPTAATVQQAEQLKQYLNNVWQPRTARLIRGMKDAIDQDVTSAAGEDIYRQARAVRAMRAVTLDDPNGIAKIMDASGPDNVNRSVAVERIPDTIASLPNAQFAHIVKTLQTVPPEIQPAAQAALAEIKAQFANRMRDAGMGPSGQAVPGGSWRARGVTDYLNKNAAKMQLVFSPEEMASIRDLNDAGHILAKDTSYPGAAVQAHNLVQRGAIAALPKIGAATGATIGSMFLAPGTGALIGEAAGAGLAGKISEAGSLRATQKRVVKVRDFLK